jgi:hypothetical protein
MGTETKIKGDRHHFFIPFLILVKFRSIFQPTFAHHLERSVGAALARAFTLRTKHI